MELWGHEAGKVDCRLKCPVRVPCGIELIQKGFNTFKGQVTASDGRTNSKEKVFFSRQDNAPSLGASPSHASRYCMGWKVLTFYPLTLLFTLFTDFEVL